MIFSHHDQRGLGVVEVLIGLALFSVIFIFTYETLTIFFTNQQRVLQQTQAVYLAEAGQESVRFLRDADWNTLTDLSVGTEYYLSVSTSSIATSTTPEVIDGTFTRSFLLWPAYRNADDDLVASTTVGASADSGTFIITTIVRWGTDQEVRLQSLLANLQNS